MDDERFDELRDAYVLGALPDEERSEFERYLAAHPERQAEVDELGALANLLALSPHEQEPPPELRDRIMGVVRVEAQEVEARVSRTGGRYTRSRTRQLLDVRNLAFGAAAMLVVWLFSWSMLLRGEVQDLQGRVRSLESQPQGPRTVELAGTGTEQGARAELVALEDGRAVLVAENMPPVLEHKTYQIWVIKDEVPEPGGLFEPEGGPVAAVVKKPLQGADAVAVTVEPEGGSKRPTGEPVLVAEVKS